TIGIAAAGLVVLVVLAVILVPKFTGDPSTPGPGSTSSADARTAACRWDSDGVGGTSATNIGKPAATVPAAGHTLLTFTTNRGVITVDVDRAKTPCAAASMAFLAGK